MVNYYVVNGIKEEGVYPYTREEGVNFERLLEVFSTDEEAIIHSNGWFGVNNYDNITLFGIVEFENGELSILLNSRNYCLSGVSIFNDGKIHVLNYSVGGVVKYYANPQSKEELEELNETIGMKKIKRVAVKDIDGYIKIISL